MRAKLSVLRASRRLLRPSGRLAFFSISLAPGLSASLRRQALDAGPPAPDPPNVTELVRRAGFLDVDEIDVTAEYLVTARAWLDARVRHRRKLRPLDPDIYDDRVAQGRKSIVAIEHGLLRRTLHTARAR